MSTYTRQEDRARLARAEVEAADLAKAMTDFEVFAEAFNEILETIETRRRIERGIDTPLAGEIARVNAKFYTRAVVLNEAWLMKLDDKS